MALELSVNGMGLGLGWDLWAGLLYAHRFAVLMSGTNLDIGKVSERFFKEVSKKASENCLVTNQDNISLPDNMD